MLSAAAKAFVGSIARALGRTGGRRCRKVWKEADRPLFYFVTRLVGATPLTGTRRDRQGDTVEDDLLIFEDLHRASAADESQECGMRGRPTRPKHLDQTPVTRVDLRGVGRWRRRRWRRRRRNRLWQSYGVQVETQLAEYKDGCSPETTFPLLRFLVTPFLFWTNVTPLEYPPSRSRPMVDSR